MKKVAIILLLTFITFKSYSQTKNFIDKPYLKTTATVDTLVVPDLIYLSILITEKDTKGRISVEKLENKMDKKLTSMGIDTKKQLALSDLASNFKKYFLKKTDVLKAKSYTLLVYDAKTAGKVIAELESISISNVNLSKIEYSKMDQLKIILKQKAVIKAKEQAEAMLKPLNQNLGKAIYISDLNIRIRGLLGNTAIAMRSYANKADEEPIDIEFKKIKIESTVNVNFEIN